MTKQDSASSAGVPEGAPASTEPLIEITSAMVEAGIQAMRDFHFGESEAKIVEAIYLAMALERQAISSAFSTSRER